MKQDIQELWDNYKRYEYKQEKKRKISEELFEAIITENYVKLMLDTKPQNQKAQGHTHKHKLNLGISYSNFRK